MKTRIHFILQLSAFCLCGAFQASGQDRPRGGNYGTAFTGLGNLTNGSVNLGATSPWPTWSSPLITNGQGWSNTFYKGYTQLSGLDTDGSNQYLIFNQGVAKVSLANWTVFTATNFNYPYNYLSAGGGSNNWCFCGGKLVNGQLVVVANNFTLANYTLSSGTELYFFDTNLNLLQIQNLNNFTTQNIEDFVILPNGTALFGFFTSAPYWSTNYLLYNTNTTPWSSNGVMSINYPLYGEGGMCYSNGNLYVSGTPFQIYFPNGTFSPSNYNGLPFTQTNLAADIYANLATTSQSNLFSYYSQYTGFVTAVPTTLQLVQYNFASGLAVPVVQFADSANGGCGSPEILSNAIFQPWNYSPGNIGGGGFTNNVQQYSLTQTNFSLQSYPTGLTQIWNLYAYNLFAQAFGYLSHGQWIDSLYSAFNFLTVSNGITLPWNENVPVPVVANDGKALIYNGNGGILSLDAHSTSGNGSQINFDNEGTPEAYLQDSYTSAHYYQLIFLNGGGVTGSTLYLQSNSLTTFQIATALTNVGAGSGWLGMISNSLWSYKLSNSVVVSNKLN